LDGEGTNDHDPHTGQARSASDNLAEGHCDFWRNGARAPCSQNAVDCKLGGPQDFCKAECRACNAWWAAHNALHVELALDPWIWPCVPCCPVPPGTPRAREWRPDREQKKLYDLLREARRVAIATTKRKKEEGPDDANVDAAGPDTDKRGPALN
jgi:hypothetical protein